MPSELEWDGRDQQGRLLPSGLYVVELKSAARVRSGRFLLVR